MEKPAMENTIVDFPSQKPNSFPLNFPDLPMSCVNHEVLLDKLEFCGINNMTGKLIKSYLTDRYLIFISDSINPNWPAGHWIQNTSNTQIQQNKKQQNTGRSNKVHHCLVNQHIK
jgi:hypothetical protein